MFSESKPGAPGSGFWNVSLRVEFSSHPPHRSARSQYSASAVSGSIVQVYVSANNDFLQPPEANSMLPVIEIVDANGTRYQTCGYYGLLPGQVNNLPCVNRLPGNQYLSSSYYAFQVPGSGNTPFKFYVRISDERGDARPDFIYTFGIHGVN